MRYLTLSVLLLASLCASAAERLPDYPLLKRDAVVEAAKGATAERFPDADSALIDDIVFTEYAPDGTDATWDDEYTKILTEKGRREASTLTLGFNAFYGNIRVLLAEIIKPDGRVIPVDVKANSRVMIDPSQMGSNIYDPNDKQLSLSVPGLEIGDLRHVLVCRETLRTRIPDTWCDYTTFESTTPILSLRYVVSEPTERPMKKILLRSPVADTVAYTKEPGKGGRTLHTWQARNVPRMFPEPDMPPSYTVVQRLLLSTLPDWETVSRWYAKLCEKPLADVTPEMREKVAELIRDAKTREEKIHAIFTFVSQQIRYMGVTTEDVAPGYEPHPVSITFKNRYGVCRDKAALLVAMLRLAGFDAYPVIINVGPKKDPDAPMPYFNHAITGVRNEDGSYQLMDSTNENTADLFPAYLGNCSYLVATEAGDPLRVSPVYPAEKELLTVDTSGTLEETGTAVFHSAIAFAGINDNLYRGFFLRSKKEKRRAFFERILKAKFPGAEVLTCEITPENLQDTRKPLAVRLAFRVSGYPVRGDSLDVLPLPWIGTGLGYANIVVGKTGLKERKYPMLTEIACGVKERVSISLGSAMGLPLEFPPATDLDRGGIAFRLEMAATNGVLTATRDYLVKSVEFSPADYLTLKQTLTEVEQAGKFRPLFAAKGRDGVPDSEILFDHTQTRVTSATSYETLHTWSRRILTYNGTKKHAEVKIGYNPAWQTLDLVSAVVSNKNGKVFSAASQEIHRMDASWVSAAPRYPAGKELVVNLPGVEVGSVITVTTRFVQTNDTFYCKALTFGGFEPTKDERFTLAYPSSLPRPRFRLFHPASVEFASETNANDVVYSWTSAGLPTVKQESALPPWYRFQPTLFLSCGNWKDYAALLYAAFDRVLAQSGKAAEEAHRLVKDAATPREKILAIRNEVMRTIRVAGPGFLSLPLDTLSAPDRTLADRYGHAADRALLLTAMLRAVGVDADLVIASGDATRYPAYAFPRRELPQDGYFHELLVRVRDGGRVYLLNEGTQYSELGSTALDGAYALTRGGVIETLHAEPEMQNRDVTDIVVDLEASGDATLTVTNWVFGSSVGVYRRRYKEMLPEDLRRHALEVAGHISKSAELVSPFVTETEAYPGYTAYSVAVKKFATTFGKRLSVSLFGLDDPIFPLQEDRRENPLFLNRDTPEEVRCLVRFPKGYTRLELVPSSLEWIFPDGLGTYAFRVSQKLGADGRLCVTLTRELKRATGETPAELYPTLLEYNRLSTHPSRKTIVAAQEE